MEQSGGITHKLVGFSTILFEQNVMNFGRGLLKSFLKLKLIFQV